MLTFPIAVMHLWTPERDTYLVSGRELHRKQDVHEPLITPPVFYFDWMIYALLLSIILTFFLPSLPSVHVDQGASDLRAPFRAFLLRTYMGAPMGILIRPDQCPRWRCLSSRLQSSDTSAVDTSLAEGTRRKMVRAY